MEWMVNHYVKAISRWLWVIVLVTLIAGATGFGASLLMHPVYRAQATVMTGADNTNPQVKTDDWVLSQRMAAGYAALAKRQPVLEAAVRTLGLQADWRRVQDNVLVVPVANTNLLEIRVSDSDRVRAAALANEIARQLLLQSPTNADLQQLNQRQAFTQAQLDSLQTNIQATEADLAAKQQALDSETSARAVMDLKDQIKADQTKIADWRAEYGKLLSNIPTRGAATITIIESASPPDRPISPVIPLNVGLAALAGLVLSIGAVLLIEYLNAGKVRTEADAASALDNVRVLGSIGEDRRRPGKNAKLPLAVTDAHSQIAEDFRLLRTNLRFLSGSAEPITFLVTSPGMGEGKSTVSANLAASFALSGKRTILVDADLRHPTLHTHFDLDVDGDGLTTLLFDMESDDEISTWQNRWLETTLRETSVRDLRLLPAGRVVDSSPGELLASERVSRLLHMLRGVADVVIFDTPPVLSIADASILAGLDDIGVLIVAGSGSTTPKALRSAVAAFENSSAQVRGVVINRVSSALKQGYEYYSRYNRDQKREASHRPALLRARPRG